MSSDGEEAADEVCASCGKSAVDDVKLKICTACKLVKYCSVVCQKNHRKLHKKACKKRSAEIRDDRLFMQSDESYLGECPICCLPMPLDNNKWSINSCCGKTICRGCSHANVLRETLQGLEERCPFCREPLSKTDEEIEKNQMKRVKANDPAAIFKMGEKCHLQGDIEGTFQYWIKAANLGHIMAHHNLSVLYHEGVGVEKDNKKEVYHLEIAAIGGHPDARFNLGNHEGRKGRFDRAAKHWIIAAKLGYDEALEAVKKLFLQGVLLSKEDYEGALRGYQAAIEATKSTQREEAYKFYNL